MPTKLKQRTLWPECSLVPEDWPPAVDRDPRFTKVVALWVPKRLLVPGGFSLDALLADARDKLEHRGLVLWDGQLLMTPITAKDSIDVIFEGEDIWYPRYYDWGQEQRDYFGLVAPYQMTEDDGEYTYSHITARIVEPYLYPDERVAGLLHGREDRHYFYCECHEAQVVYTTHHRLVCMGCGAMHAVLRNPLSMTPKRLLTQGEWLEYFDPQGCLCDEEVELSVVDFRDVEDADMIWMTEQWHSSKHEFVFFARSTPEEIEAAVRNTERDPRMAGILKELGWQPAAVPPPPAYQIDDESVQVDLVENAIHSLREGVACYLNGRTAPGQLTNAVPQLFRTMELLLKARLRELAPDQLKDKPNNPEVLRRLKSVGVTMTATDSDAVKQIRQLRNHLQHGEACFNHRSGLALCRKALVFLDRFMEAELGLWMGNAVSPDSWFALLSIPELAATADRVVAGLLAEVRHRPGTTISVCPHCTRDAVVRPDPGSGASCYYCRHVPLMEDTGPE